MSPSAARAVSAALVAVAILCLARVALEGNKGEPLHKWKWNNSRLDEFLSRAFQKHPWARHEPNATYSFTERCMVIRKTSTEKAG